MKFFGKSKHQFLSLLLLLTATGSLAEEKIWGTPVKSPAVRTEPNKSFMFSDGGPTDRNTIKVTGNEKWYGFYVSLDRKKIVLKPTVERSEAIVVRDYDGVSWSLGRKDISKEQNRIPSEVAFFGIPDLENGPKEGSLAVFSKKTCEKEGKRPTPITIGFREEQVIPAGASICVSERLDYSLGSKTVTFTKEYVKSTPVSDVSKIILVTGGQSVEVMHEEAVLIGYVMDLGDDGSLEVIMNYFKNDTNDDLSRHIRMVRIANGKVQILYDGIDPLWY